LRGDTKQSEGTEKLKPKEQNRGGKLSEKREEQKETERRVKEQKEGERQKKKEEGGEEPPFLSASTASTATARD
jgi:hypothetical protein